MDLLFADFDSGWIVGIGGVVTAVISGVVVVLNTLHKNHQESRAAAVVEQNAVIEYLRKEILRHEANIAAQQVSIESIRQMHSDCREEGVELRGYILLLYDYAKRTHAALRTAGIVYEPPPTQPTARTTHGKAADFLARTVAQNQALQEVLMPPATPTGE